MFDKDTSLADLVNLDEWQKIQDSFAEALEITMKTISLDGAPLSKISRPSRYCSDIYHKIPDIDNLNGGNPSIDKQKRLAAAAQNGGSIKLPFGVESFVVPIKAIGDRDVAYVMLGPIIPKSRKTASEYAKEAQKYSITIDELTDILIEINVFSYNKIYSITSLVRDIFSYMAQTGYHKKRLGEIAPEVVEMDPLFSRYYEEKILKAMLRTCSLALNADSGSVMILDKKTNTLRIKASSRLDDKIVNNTSIKIGEGIAGVAAATAKPIILPKDKSKNGLAVKMRRKDIKSSMIMPFNKGTSQDVYGVLNLNITRKNIDFSDRDIALVKQLVNMTSIALLPLYQQT